MKKIKISFVLNIIIVIFTILASIMMFTGFKFMYGMEPVLEVTKLGMFKFFTVDSNLLVGISALILAIYERKLLNNKITIIPVKYYILKFIATVSVSLTFLVVFFYLGPISPNGISSMLQNSNLFFHLIIPILSIVSFILFEYNNSFRFKYILYSVIPTIGYEVFYLINALIHIENGKVSPKYDWYYFIQGGLWQIIIMIPFMVFITYVIGIMLWIANKKFSN